MGKKAESRFQDGICYLLNSLGKITAKLSPKMRGNLLTLSFMMISICAFIYSIFPIYVHLLFKCIIGAFFMGGILIFSIDREIKPVKLNPWIARLWFAFGGIRLLTGFVTSIEYVPLACIWLVGFPLIFFVWINREDYETLFQHIFKAFIIPLLIFFILSIFLSPINGNSGYAGITSNTGAVGQKIAPVFPLAVSTYFWGKERKRLWKVLSVICIFLSISFAFYSWNRMITVTIAGVILVATICALIDKQSVKKIVLSLIVLAVGSVVITEALLPVNHALTAVFSSDAVTEEKDSEMDEVFYGYLDRMEGKDKQKVTVNDYSSGRVGIWVEALSKTNLFGHPSREHIVTDRNGDVGNNTHNVFIQFIYDNGIIAGVLFIIINISAGLILLSRCLWEKERRHLYFTLALIAVSYWGISLFISTNLPFLYEISFVFYLVFAVMFDSKAGRICARGK